MILVPSYIGPSQIHGIGVFAAAFIDAGTRIWEYDPSVDIRLSPEEFEQFPEPFRAWIKVKICPDDGLPEHRGLYLLSVDNSAYLNHSDDPNCGSDERYMFTLRPVAAHEELTCEYRRDGVFW